MDYRIQHSPAFSVVEFQLNEAEEVIAQPDSMISMTAGVEISAAVAESASSRGYWSGVKSMLGGESFFRVRFRAKRDDQTLLLAPETYGEIVTLNVGEVGGMFLARGSYLAHVGECRLRVQYGGMKGLISKTGLFLLNVSGTGTVFCQTYGAVVERVLAADERFFIDNRYIVAFSESVQYQLVKSSDRLRDTLMSGEGFINRFTGPGRVLYQTRAKPAGGLLRGLFNAFT